MVYFRKMTFLFIVIILFLSGSAQNKQGFTWVIGEFGYQISFSTNPVTHNVINLSNTTNTPFWFGQSCINDSLGQLILISDGLNLYNKNGIFIEGGDTLASLNYYNFMQGWNRFPQGSIIIPMDSGIYYLVTPSCNDTNLTNIWQNGGSSITPDNLMLYNKVDMKLNAGAGKVIQRMMPLLENKELSKTQMMACRHSNGKDWWVLKMAGDSSNVYSFLFTQDSAYFKGIQRFNFPFSGYNDNYGELKFNSIGSQMATTYSNQTGEIYVADFDRCYGLMSNPKKYTAPVFTLGDSANTGLAYSPNGRFLYVCKYNNVFQLDLQDNNMSTAWYRVSDMDTDAANFCGYTSLELGPDGKIYCGHFHAVCRQMSTIDNPDLKGSNCNFCRYCLRSLNYQHTFTTPPNVPNYALSGQACWPLSNEELMMENGQLEVWPNPAYGKIQIKCKNLKAKKELYNYLGQLIFSTNENEMDVSRFTKGVYYVRCDGQVKKVLVE